MACVFFQAYFSFLGETNRYIKLEATQNVYGKCSQNRPTKEWGKVKENSNGSPKEQNVYKN